MDKVIHEIEVVGRLISVRPGEEFVAGNVGVDYVSVAFADDSWDGLSKTVVFEGDDGDAAAPLSGSPVLVPWEVIQGPGTLRLTVVGTDSSGEVRMVTRRMSRGIDVMMRGLVEPSRVPPEPTRLSTPRR